MANRSGNNRPDRRKCDLSPLVLKLGYGVEERRKPKRVGLNARGVRVGEDHPRAKLTDHEVDLLLQMLEEADADKAAGRPHLTRRELADKFEISLDCLYSIQKGRTRGQTPERYKTILTTED